MMKNIDLEAGRRVMLAILNISVWRARKFDRGATAEVESNHNAVGKEIGRFNKRLLPKGPLAPEYAALLGWEARVRAFHEANTLVYDQRAVRLLPADSYMEHAERLREFRRELDVLVPPFLDALEGYKTTQRAELNGLYRDADYPRRDEIAGKFGLRFRVLPFPDASQFGIALPEEALVSTREHNAEALSGAMLDVWTRLYEVVGKMAERLGKTGVPLKSNDTFVENLREICELVPRLNFAHDEALESLRASVLARLGPYDLNTLKDSPVARMTAAQEANQLQSLMAEYMGITPTPLDDASGETLELLAA